MALQGNFDTIAVRVQNGFKRVHQGAVCAGFCRDKLKLDTEGVETGHGRQYSEKETAKMDS